MFKGKKETDMFREGKKLTRKQAILANCYICNGENEGGVDCLGGKNCPLYQYNPYGGLKKRANGTFPGSKSIVALPMIVFLVAFLLSATTSFLVARGEMIDKPNTPGVCLKASWYSIESLAKEGTTKFSKNIMANGKPFDENAMTCATRLYPLGKEIIITNLKNNKSIKVKVTDRIGKRFAKTRIDLSKGAFEHMACLKEGLIPVKVEE